MNELNTKLYINNIKKKFSKCFKPRKDGIYEIKIVLNFFVKDTSNMFYDCIQLRSIDLSSLCTKQLIKMEEMFYGCEKLEKINLPSFKAQNTINMNSIFRGINLSSKTPIFIQVQRENKNVEKVAIQPYIKSDQKNKINKEVIPKVNNKVQSIRKIEVVPPVQRVDQPNTDKKIAPPIKKEIKNIPDYNQKVEQLKTDEKVVPKKEIKIQQQEKNVIVPILLRKGKDNIQKKIIPKAKRQTKIIKKKLQTVFKDDIQPGQIKYKPVHQEGLRSTIFKNDKVNPFNNPGIKTVRDLFRGKKVIEVLNTDFEARKSIPENNVLLTENSEIGLRNVSSELEINLENVQFNQTINPKKVNSEIFGGAFVRETIVRNSVLPTIDGGTKVLKAIYEDYRPSTVGNQISNKGGLDNATNRITTHEEIDLGTTIHKPINLGVINKEIINLETTVNKPIDLGVVNKVKTDLSANKGTNNIMESAEVENGGCIIRQNARNASMQLGVNIPHFQLNQENGVITSGSTFINPQIKNNQIQRLGNTDIIGTTEVNNQANFKDLRNKKTSQFVSNRPMKTNTTMRTVNYTNSNRQQFIRTSNIKNPFVKATVTGPTPNIQGNPSNI